MHLVLAGIKKPLFRSYCPNEGETEISLLVESSDAYMKLYPNRQSSNSLRNWVRAQYGLSHVDLQIRLTDVRDRIS
ncbi:hypothetical protein IWQ52_001323 [Labrenzia sp. EL_159]|nr:hypothetical protein [Labrenzia sp. EL_162]MBG6164635.1 hypothetical protein [Labrenzia sp. EL_195]MBG6193821.1 hypothetical protein [Labrenzia sp. EL_159]